MGRKSSCTTTCKSFLPNDAMATALAFFVSTTCQALALSQLVAIDDCARSACHVVKDAALDKLVCRKTLPAENATS
jgi:hypothetical protein